MASTKETQTPLQEDILNNDGIRAYLRVSTTNVQVAMKLALTPSVVCGERRPMSKGKGLGYFVLELRESSKDT